MEGDTLQFSESCSTSHKDSPADFLCCVARSQSAAPRCCRSALQQAVRAAANVWQAQRASRSPAQAPALPSVKLHHANLRKNHMPCKRPWMPTNRHPAARSSIKRQASREVLSQTCTQESLFLTFVLHGSRREGCQTPSTSSSGLGGLVLSDGKD